MSATYEVELKFPLADPAAVLQLLRRLGGQLGSAVMQRDVYFNHPQRDFAQTNEALRIRSVGEDNFVTYKGPLLDAYTKTRPELETPFEGGAEGFNKFAETLQLLGFRRVREVSKIRTPYELEWGERHWELALDSVDGLGTFVEIETLADEATRVAAQTQVLELARRLGLGASERKSYLELLLEKGVS